MTIKSPRAFISYSWDDDTHKDWVRELATRLRQDGVDVMLDQWRLAPGDQLPEFMERSLREHDFVLIICTPRYKQKSEARIGGVGYEGHVMTAELMTARNQRKFIPILRAASWEDASPSWLKGKYYINLFDPDRFEVQYQDLLQTLHGLRLQAPPVGHPPKKNQAQPLVTTADIQATVPTVTGPIEITSIISDAITNPRMDGTRGSGLYAIPFQLSRRPSADWAELFVETWRHPPRWTTMHRPSIAKVSGDRIILDGTTIEEVEKYHRETLLAVLDYVNERIAEHEKRQQQQAAEALKRTQEHESNVKDVANKITFD